MRQSYNIFILLLITITFSYSCKKQPGKEISSPKQKVVIPHDTAFHYDTTYHYTPGASIQPLWDQDFAATEASIMHVLETNRNIFMMVEMKKRSSFDHIYVSALNSNGELLGSTEVTMPTDGKYSLYDSFIIPQKDAFPIYYVLYERNSNKHYASDSNKDPDKLVPSLDSYAINRIAFKDSVSDFHIESTSLMDLLKDFVLDNQMVYIRKINFRKYDGNIFLYGEAHTIGDNHSNCPFIVLLDENLNVLHGHIYNEYAGTYISTIKENKNGQFILTGEKIEGFDGSYYYTNIQFEVDKNLAFLNDQSDKEPYYSYYRGPSAPDYTADGIDEEDECAADSEEEEPITAEQNISEEEETQPTEPSTIKTEKLLYNENGDKPYYTITYDEKNMGETMLEKVSPPDSTIIFKRNISLSENYFPATACETSDGGFVLAFVEKHRTGTMNDYDKNAYRSKVLLFRFNKEGNLSHQYETESYVGIVRHLNIFETTNNRLTAIFISQNSYFDGEWHYPQKLKAVAFPL